jgi:hypothetical protein
MQQQHMYAARWIRIQGPSAQAMNTEHALIRAKHTSAILQLVFKTEHDAPQPPFPSTDIPPTWSGWRTILKKQQ